MFQIQIAIRISWISFLCYNVGCNILDAIEEALTLAEKELIT